MKNAVLTTVATITEMTQSEYTPISGYTFECHNDYGTFGNGSFTVKSGETEVKVNVDLSANNVAFFPSFTTDKNKTRQENFATHSLLMNVWGNIESLNKTLAN